MPTPRAVLLAVLLGLLLGAAPAQAGTVTPLPVGTDVDYQLGGAAKVPGNVGIVVRDRTARPSGRYDVCYVNGFQSQPDEKRYWSAHKDLLLHDKQGRLVEDEAWGEWLLDIRTAAKRSRLASLVDTWTRGCKTSGFDAVEYDNLDSYTRSHHLITRAQALAFARLLTASAHRAGLAAGQKNLSDLDGRTVGYDFAVSESCAQFDECADYARSFGRRVLMVEYDDRSFAKACRGYGATHPVVRRDLDLAPTYRPRFC